MRRIIIKGRTVLTIGIATLAAFFAMVASPEYREAAPLRQQSLIDSRLIAVRTSPAEETPGWQLAFPEGLP